MHTNNEAVDITDFLPADSAILTIRNPGTNEPTQWKITIAGPSHPKTQAWADDMARRNLRKAAKLEAAQMNGRKLKPEERDIEDMRSENIQWIVSRIIDWTPIKIGDTVYEFSENSAKDLLSQPNMGWAFGQILDFISEEASFTKRSAET
jgi:hypothetical protein